MPRPLRPVADGFICHVINRGNNRVSLYIELREHPSGRGYYLSIQFSSLKLMLPKRLEGMLLLRLATIDQRYESGKRS